MKEKKESEEVKKVSLLPLAIIVLLIPTFFLLSRPAWVEPDSLAFYNRTCLDGNDFNTPIFSKAIFSIIPCNEIYWKLFQLFLIFGVFSSLYYGCKRFGIDTRSLWLLGLLYFFNLFLLALEDDHIALPLIIGLSFMMLSRSDWKSKIAYAISIPILTLLIWEGSFVPMTIILAGSIFFALAPLSIIVAYLIGELKVRFEAESSELMSGLGFLTNNILTWLFLLKGFDKPFLLKNAKLFGILVSILALTFVVPKFGVFILIPLLPLAGLSFGDNKKIFNILVIAGLLSLVVSSSNILINEQPTSEMWDLVEESVEIQKSGEPFFNEWWVGRWIAYKGGIPTAEGGYLGDPILPHEEYYWLGLENENCETINSVDVAYLQLCNKKE